VTLGAVIEKAATGPGVYCWDAGEKLSFLRHTTPSDSRNFASGLPSELYLGICLSPPTNVVDERAAMPSSPPGTVHLHPWGTLETAIAVGPFPGLDR